MHGAALRMDPSANPAVLDTATWDVPAAVAAVLAVGEGWRGARETIAGGRTWRSGPFVLRPGARPGADASAYALAALADGQRLLVRLGPSAPSPLGEPCAALALSDGTMACAYPASAAVVDRYCRELAPRNAPRALGAIPRLGIGTRMTTAVWPGIFRAMGGAGFAANAIQNSVRELNLLDDLLAGRSPVRNYACGFGAIDSGYTGSSFEGLWLSGVLAALEHDAPLAYGADADHIQPKRDDPTLERAKRTIEAAQRYTFFTLDISDVLDYAALAGGPTPAALSRKYDDAFAIVEQLCEHVASINGHRPFDLELSIDEHPPEVPAFACLTSAEELAFVLARVRELGLPVTHVAPNLGVEKGVDYRHPSGLDGLEQRTRAASRIAEEAGVMLDIHSADDLGPGARRALRAATGGRIHYKISPSLQLLFAETLGDHDPTLFAQWREDAEAYARREAQDGSAFAAACLAAPPEANAVRHPVFHHFSFAFVGRRRDGRFVDRERFYRLGAAFLDDYAARVERRLCDLAADLF
jgi:hypothetical protein